MFPSLFFSFCIHVLQTETKLLKTFLLQIGKKQKLPEACPVQGRYKIDICQSYCQRIKYFRGQKPLVYVNSVTWHLTLGRCNSFPKAFLSVRESWEMSELFHNFLHSFFKG